MGEALKALQGAMAIKEGKREKLKEAVREGSEN
jgi:hypothetical protein